MGLAPSRSLDWDKTSKLHAQHSQVHTFRASIAMSQRSSDSGTGMPAFCIAVFRSRCSSAGTSTCAKAACLDNIGQCTQANPAALVD